MTARQIAGSSSPRRVHHLRSEHVDVPPDTDHRRGPEEREAVTELFAALRMLPAGHPHREELRNRLVERYLPLAGQLASRFRDRGQPLEDLTQVATIGLIQSVERFDPQYGAQFSTFAIPTIVGELKRHFRDHSWAIHVPRSLQELRQRLNAATAELSQRSGRSPTVTELAAHLEVTDEEILEALEAGNAYSTLSLDAPAQGDEDQPAIVDSLGDDDADLTMVENRESLKPLLAGLPCRERKILLLRFYGNMSQTQIAEELGISQMQVSRLLSRTLKQLRDWLLTEH
jgi:RNA polymerase sigma-B factor